jgi:hypothetical protein
MVAEVPRTDYSPEVGACACRFALIYPADPPRGTWIDMMMSLPCVFVKECGDGKDRRTGDEWSSSSRPDATANL